jgi:4'-phosphopantetheinyl transferase
MSLLDAEQPGFCARVVYAYPETIVAQLEHAVLLACLSADEHERYARFHFDEDRVAYLVAHALTRHLIAEAARVEPAALRFTTSEHGKPELCYPDAAIGLRFNLSHTRGLVACAITQQRAIGVDVERIDRRVELLAVARHVFSPREITALTALADEPQRLRFFELWTLKEAYIKAIGKGLSAPLRAISFFPECADPVPVHFDAEAADDPAAWCFRRHIPSANFRLAVALQGDRSAAASFHEATASDLLDSQRTTA